MLVRIFGYFLAEAAVSLRRSWKVSLVAIVIIAMSLFIGGTFLLLTTNLSRVVESWRDEARIVIYLTADEVLREGSRALEIASGPPWVTAVEEVSAAEARSRFETTFPSVRELFKDWKEEPLPPSLEVAFEKEGVEEERLDEWLVSLRSDPSVVMVDDDRDWLRQLEALIAMLTGLGAVVGLVLLTAAIFTIASVIRLTAYLYRDEIEVMRLVGATELFIRGPFYVEGIIQGLLGGFLALAGLYGGYLLLNPKASTTFLGNVLVDRFLSPEALMSLLLLGSLAGLLGAVLSLRREELGH
jgi:cell division transport system permease protein